MDQEESLKPLISVVIPVYNVEKYIHNSVKSVLNQTYTNWELILVDDGSTDNCATICDRYAAEFDQATVVHRANGGQGAARNSGLTSARGEYVYFLDSDDVIQPETLQRFVDVLNEHGRQDLIFSRFQRVLIDNIFKKATDDDGVELFNDRKALQRAFLLRTHIILAPGTLYRVEWLKSSKLCFEQIRYSEDLLFVWKALLRVGNAAFVKRSLYNYLDRPGSTMTSSKAKTIVKSYPAFCELEQLYLHSDTASEEAKKYLLSRWIFGIARSGSKLTSYSEYKKLLDSIDAEKHFKTLESFPDAKLKVFLMIRKISKRLFYQMCKHT